jgi:putative endonuclease
VSASPDNTLHFTEVKTRRTRKFGNPENDVSKKKIETCNASKEYQFPIQKWKLIRFNMLAITVLKNKPAEFLFIEEVYLQ